MPNKNAYVVVALLCGLATTVLPIAPPFGVLVLFSASFAFVLVNVDRRKLLAIYVPLAIAMQLVVYAGLVQSSALVSVLAALTLLHPSVARPRVAIVILALQLSATSTLISALEGTLPQSWSGLGAPSVISCILAMAVMGSVLPWLLAGVGSAGLSALVIHTTWPADYQVLIAAVPILFTAFRPLAHLPSEDIEKNNLRYISIAIVACCVALWALHPPRLTGAIRLLAPHPAAVSDSPEWPLFSNAAEALAFSVTGGEVIDDLAKAPYNSTVIVPWPIAEANLSVDAGNSRRIASEKRLTIILFGEHNDYLGASSTITKLTDCIALRRDLSVPPGNADTSGHLRSSSLLSWPPDAILNRGATVEISSMRAMPLLSGETWHSDPDIREPLWVGDFLVQPDDRRGRLVLSGTCDDMARWVVVGDNSLVLSTQIVSDPRPLLSVVYLSSLMPAAINDAVMLLGVVLIGLGVYRKWSSPAAQMCLLSILVLGIAIALALRPTPSSHWEQYYVGQTGFDPRNFSSAMLAAYSSPTLKEVPFVRFGEQHSLPPISDLPKRSVIFGLVGSDLKGDDWSLHSCSRIGRVEVKGIYLMESQACRLDGNAEVLIGDKEQAVAIRAGERILILDPGFLSARNNWKDNLTWLDRAMNNRPSKDSDDSR